VIEGEHGKRGAAIGLAHGFLPAFGIGRAGQPMLMQQALQPLPCPARIAGEDDAAAVARERADMAGDRFVDIGILRAFRREIARRLHAEIEHRRAFRLVERGREMDRAVGNRLVPLGFRKVERGRLERTIATGLHAERAHPIAMIVHDRFEALLRRHRDRIVANHDILGREMIEERGKPLFQHWQPMFHPGETAAFGDRLIKRVAGGGRAEFFAVTTAGRRPSETA